MCKVLMALIKPPFPLFPLFSCGGCIFFVAGSLDQIRLLLHTQRSSMVLKLRMCVDDKHSECVLIITVAKGMRAILVSTVAIVPITQRISLKHILIDASFLHNPLWERCLVSFTSNLISVSGIVVTVWQTGFSRGSWFSSRTS